MKGIKMNTWIRIVVVLVSMTVVIAVGLKGPAWAEKLQTGEQVPTVGSPTQGSSDPDPLQTGEQVPPAAGSLAQVSPEAGRPLGTVITTPTCVQSLVPGSFAVGSVADWVLDNVAGGQVYEACVAEASDLPAQTPAVLLTPPIKLTELTGAAFGVTQRVCFPVPPGQNASAFYWDGHVWVQTEDAKDGKACVTVAAEAPVPTFVALGQTP